MKNLLLAMLLAGVPSLAQAETITVAGVERSYIVDRAPGGKPGPVIIALHGGGGSARQFKRASGLTPVANAAGVSVVYPESITRQWNDGRAHKDSRVDQADDFGFMAALVEELVTAGIADPSRITFTGVSNGGMMSYSLACATNIKIYAVAPVSANVDQGLDCSHANARLVNIVGTSDRIVPMEGGPVLFGWGQGAVESARKSFAMFLKAHECNGTVSHALPDTADDGMTSAITSGQDCAVSPVAQIVVKGGGHSWPGTTQAFGRKRGVATLDFSASEWVVKLAAGTSAF